MKPLGIALGIDFAKLDRDLSAVANRIESVGKSARIDVGGGGIGGGGDVAAKIGDVGERLSAGIAGGVRSAGALMFGFAAHVDNILNRVSGAAITMFERIDAAMKFPKFDAFFQRAQSQFTNLSALWRKPLSGLDVALQGGFGGPMKGLARTLKALFDDLAASIAKSMADAFAGAARGGQQVVKQATEIQAAWDHWFAVMGNFDAGPFAVIGAELRLLKAELKDTAMVQAVMGVGKALQFTASVAGKFAAAMVSVPLRVYNAFARLGNFLSSLGDVAGKSFDKLYRSALRISTLGILGRAPADMGKLGQSAASARGSVDQLTGSVMALGRQLLVAFGVVGVVYKFVQFIKQAVTGAADLETATNAAKVTFGDAFGGVNAQVDELNKKFWISRKAQFDIANEMGNIAQGAGLSEEASAGMANELTMAAAEVAALRGLKFEDVGEAIASGLTGRGQELKKLGVLLDDTTVKQYAVARGAATFGGELSKSVEVAARAELIYRGLSYASGTLDASTGEASKQFRLAGGGIQEFATRVGELLLPAVKLGTEAFNELLAVTLDVFESSKDRITAWANSVSEAMAFVGKLVRNMGSYWQIAQLRVGAFVVNSIAYIETIPQNFGPVTEWVGRNWQNMLTDMWEAAKAFGTNLAKNMSDLGKAIWEGLKTGQLNFKWTGLLDGFKATTEQLPELIKPALISVDDRVNEILGEIDKKEAARAAALKGAGAGVKKPGPLEEEGKSAPDYKLASAVEVNSKEAASIIARTQGTGRFDAAKEGVKAVREGNAILQEIRNAVAKPPVQLQVR